MRRFAPFLIAALLVACTSPEEERRAAIEAERARQAHYHQRCLDYGLTPGTDAYALCRQRFDAADRQAYEMKRAVIFQHLLSR